MFYLKLFETESEKEACQVTKEYLGYTKEVDESYIHPYDFSQDYLTFVALSDGTFKFSGIQTANTISYSTDNGATWSTPSNTVTINVNNGDSVLWKGEMTPITGVVEDNITTGIGSFSGGTAQFEAKGNPMSLLYGDNYTGQTSLASTNNAFANLFNASKIVTANHLNLDFTLSSMCYASMFFGCTDLTTVPELQETTLVYGCYYRMFYGCTSLVNAPTLQATTLADTCYREMFQDCTSLVSVPNLNASALAPNCYRSMFNGCTSLTQIQVALLTATTLSDGCYKYMFANCTSLTQAPEFTATTLAPNCYESMFQSCSALTSSPQIQATAVASYCCNNMFNGCKSLTTAPSVLPAAKLSQSCYARMFFGCISLRVAPELPQQHFLVLAMIICSIIV